MRKLLLLGLCMILLSSFADAAIMNVRDQDSGGTNWNGTSNSDEDDLTTGGWTANEGAMLYEELAAADYDGDGFGMKWVVAADARYNYVNASLTDTNWVTIMFYDDATDNSVYMVASPDTTTGGNQGMTGVYTSANFGGGNYVVYNADSCAVDGWCDTGITRSTGWHNFSYHFLFNGTYEVYINGTLVNYIGQAATVFTKVGIYQNENAGDFQCATCYWDYFTFWNDTYIPKPSPNMNVTISFPKNDSGFDAIRLVANKSTIWINGTHNLSIYAGCTINDTKWSPGINATENFSFYNNTYLDITGSYHWINITCYNHSMRNISDTVMFLIDAIPPEIVTSEFDNMIAVYWTKNWTNNISGQINVTDNTLYDIKVNTTVGGTIRYVSNIVGTLYQINISWNVTNHSFGLNTIIVETRDGHTDYEIGVWDYSKNILTKRITFDFKRYLFESRYISISPLDLGLFDGFNVEKRNDSYIYKISKQGGTKELSFLVSSSHFIDISKKKDYDGWLVIPDLNKWNDFELEDATGKETYKIERVDANNVRVTISNLPLRNEYVFMSIGNMNKVVKTFYWVYTNATMSYFQNHLEQTTTDYFLNISTFGVLNTSADFIYQGVRYDSTKKEFTEYDEYSQHIQHPQMNTSLQINFTFNWTFNITTNATTYQYMLSENDTLYKMGVGHCNGTYNDTAINFSVINDGTGERMHDFDFEGSFTIWDDNNTAFTRTYGLINTSLNYVTHYCLFPHFAEYVVNYQALFTRTGFDNAQHIVVGGYLNTTMKTVTVYMINSTASTKITVTVVDENDDELAGYIVEAQRYSVADSNYSVRAQEYTDLIGQVNMYIDVSTYEYRWVVKNPDGEIVLVEPKQKLIQTEYTLKVTLGTTPTVILLGLYDLSIYLTKDRTNKDFNLSWAEISYTANDILFEVWRSNSTNGTRLLYNATSTDNTGKMSYHITESTTNLSITFTGKVYINSSEDNNYYFIMSKTLDYVQAWDMLGIVESAIVSFIFIGTLMFMGLAFGAEAAIIISIAALILSRVIGMYVVSWSALAGLILSFIILFVRMQHRK